MHYMLEKMRKGSHWFDGLMDYNNLGAIAIASSG